MFNYKFCIEVDIQGRQRPSIKFSHNKNLEQLEHLSHLAYGYMSSSAYVRKKVLEGIQDVISNKKEVHHFAGDDWCMVSFRDNKSLISNGMDSFEPFEIESKLLSKLIEDWYVFLLAWENGEIPGILHPQKKRFRK